MASNVTAAKVPSSPRAGTRALGDRSGPDSLSEWMVEHRLAGHLDQLTSATRGTRPGGFAGRNYPVRSQLAPGLDDAGGWPTPHNYSRARAHTRETRYPTPLVVPIGMGPGVESSMMRTQVPTAMNGLIGYGALIAAASRRRPPGTDRGPGVDSPQGGTG
jgi:hypothetical protein